MADRARALRERGRCLGAERALRRCFALSGYPSATAGPSGTRVALDDVSLELERGQIMGIFGPSGSGKTTLLRIAAGLRKPDSGTVTYNGERLDRMSAGGADALSPPRDRVRVGRRSPGRSASVWSTMWRCRCSWIAAGVAAPSGGSARRCSPARRSNASAWSCASSPTASVSASRSRARSSPNLGCCSPTARRRTSRCSSRRASWCCSPTLAHQARVAVLITDSDAETLLRADPILYLRDGKLVDPEPIERRREDLPVPVGRVAPRRSRCLSWSTRARTT